MEATPTLLTIGINHDTIFYQKCNYCGVFSSFWRDEVCFETLCKGFQSVLKGSTPFKKGLATLLQAGMSVYDPVHHLYM